MQSQALLTSQMEELTLQLRLAQARQREEETSGSKPEEAWNRWATPMGYASAGAMAGAVCAAILLSGLGGR
jgi:hypothetical protein